MRRLVLLVLLGAGLPAATWAQVPQPTAAAPMLPVPAELRGAWFNGSCAAPDAMLHLTARSAARLPERGAARLVRFTETRRQGEWTIGTGRGAEAPRLMLRGNATAIETAEPDAKLRDDRLPGDTALRAWHRCPAPPPAFAALHGEGIAMLGTLETLEAACGTREAGVTGCIAAIVAAGDVSGDKLLSVAEIARLVRGMAWVLAAAEDAAPEGLVAAGGGGVLAGVATARFALESLDYDGDGKLSAAELGQDRAVLAPGTGHEAGRPLRLDGVQDGVNLMRGLIDGLLAEP